MKFLAVDDEVMALDFLTENIRDAVGECEIITTPSPLEALELVQKEDFTALFLDIHMSVMDGIELARKIKEVKPKTNIIFTTAYSEYMGDAFGLSASDYLLKPIMPDMIRKSIDNLRYPAGNNKKQLKIQCFGNFEVFVDGNPVRFKLQKTKELMAYLVDRRGAACTVGEIISVLWEDDAHESYLRKCKMDMMTTLGALGFADIVYSARGNIGLQHMDSVECDYYDWLKARQAGDTDNPAINAFNGEYMLQYSWAEESTGQFIK